MKFKKNMFAVFIRFSYEHGNDEVFKNICQIYFHEKPLY